MGATCARDDSAQERKRDLNRKKKRKKKKKCILCVICCDEVETWKMVTLGHCGHSMCMDCAQTYTRAKLKDLTQYPITCAFCNVTLERRLLATLLTSEELESWDYFSVRSAIPHEQQYECPKCQQIHFRDPWPSPDEVEWIPDESQPNCMNPECSKRFTFLKRKHHCRSCGGVFCNSCSNNYLLLGKTKCRTCDFCYREFFLAKCQNPDCLLKFCTICQVEYHVGQTCEQYQKGIRDSARLAELTRVAIERLGYASCPQCGMTISKEEGCNHMTHADCPKPFEQDGKTHFCYCCNALLKAPYWHEPNGTVHFEAGLFEPCRNSKPMRSMIYSSRLQRHHRR